MSHPPASPRPMLALLGLAAAYALGLAYWLAFFCPIRPMVQWPPSLEVELAVFDWPKEVAHARVFREALADRRIPYHVDDPDGVMFNVVDGRFLGLPESILSPQILLLAVLSPEQFLLAHTLLLYSVGFAGSLALRRRYRLGPLPFAAFLALFNLNGYIAAHLAAGHSMWGGYFLLPAFVACLLAMLDEPGRRAHPIGMAAVLFAMLLQGSLHLAIWCGIFLALLAITSPGLARPLLLALALAGLMACVRLAPAAYTYRHHEQAFLGGYEDLVELAWALLRFNPDSVSRPVRFGIWWWELDLYVGLLGLAFLAWFGVVQRVAPAPDASPYRYPQLDAPLVLMTLLAIGPSYRVVFELPIPLATSERVTSRFVIVSVVVLMALSAIRLDRVLRQVGPPPRARLVAWALVLEMAAAMARHAGFWRIPRLAEFGDSYQMAGGIPAIVRLHDPAYRAIVDGSAAVSALACVAWAVLYARSRRRGSSADPGGPRVTPPPPR